MFGFSKQEKEKKALQKRNAALIIASDKGSLADVERLLSEGADINAKDKRLDTAIISASYIGHSDTVACLIKNGADLNHQNVNKASALILAAYIGHTSIVRQLLEAGADTQLRYEDGKTAAEDCATDEIRTLLKGEVWPPPVHQLTADIVTLTTSLDDKSTLRETFNFKVRERITVMVVGDAVSTPCTRKL